MFPTDTIGISKDCLDITFKSYSFFLSNEMVLIKNCIIMITNFDLIYQARYLETDLAYQYF